MVKQIASLRICFASHYIALSIALLQSTHDSCYHVWCDRHCTTIRSCGLVQFAREFQSVGSFQLLLALSAMRERSTEMQQPIYKRKYLPLALFGTPGFDIRP